VTGSLLPQFSAASAARWAADAAEDEGGVADVLPTRRKRRAEDRLRRNKGRKRASAKRSRRKTRTVAYSDPSDSGTMYDVVRAATLRVHARVHPTVRCLGIAGAPECPTKIWNRPSLSLESN
jgi:hypothetical protein